MLFVSQVKLFNIPNHTSDIGRASRWTLRTVNLVGSGMRHRPPGTGYMPVARRWFDHSRARTVLTVERVLPPRKDTYAELRGYFNCGRRCRTCADLYLIRCRLYQGMLSPDITQGQDVIDVHKRGRKVTIIPFERSILGYRYLR